MNLYKDNSLQIMHEKLKNQQLDTWQQLQNAILKEKEARKIWKKEAKQLKVAKCQRIIWQKIAKSAELFYQRDPTTKWAWILILNISPKRKHSRRTLWQKRAKSAELFCRESPMTVNIDMNFDIEYDTDPKMLKPNPRKERVKKIHSSRSNPIDYNFFYQFDANAISCRHCPYHRPAQKRFKPTRALKNHLKTNHLTVLEQYRRSNNI
ncbi:hypothetical protein niasHT_012787 [Heterodera trifolii]|uniref:Uncharacterized protein n=1 Tax=Heterodera trifolii TaxID=157864 RepID=A0ABD2L970_9BILA